MTESIDFAECLALIRSEDALTFEDGFHMLLPHVSLFVPELIDLIASESNSRIRGRFVELLGEARSPAAFSTLASELRNSDQNVRQWALRGLQMLDRPDASLLIEDYILKHPGEFK